jgi:hypothetical protein
MLYNEELRVTVLNTMYCLGDQIKSKISGVQGRVEKFIQDFV